MPARLVAVCVCVIAVALVYVGLRGLGASVVAAAILCVVALAAAIHRFVVRGSTLVSHAEWGRGPRIVAAIGAVYAVIATLRLAGFMDDPSRETWSAFPQSAFYVHHNCATSYYEAARIVHDVPNVYLEAIYRPTAAGRTIAGFNVDRFEYPPPFLLLPLGALAVTQDFMRIRLVWFAINGAIFLGTLLALARWISGRERGRVEALVPLVWCTVPALLTLQIENFQLFALCASVLAMLAFDRDRNALGGALLAFVTLSKAFPGILVLYLLFRRRWLPAAWTAGFTVLFTAVSFGVVGRPAYDAFFAYHLPRMANGDAFGMLKVMPWAVAMNESVFGLPLKLRLAGAPFGDFAIAGAVAWIYSGLLVVICYLAARRDRDRLRTAAVWIALLGLTAMRSPFLPQEYGLLPAVWLTILVAADAATRGRTYLLLLAAWLSFNALLPKEITRGVGAMIVLATIPQLAAVSLFTYVLLRRPTAEPVRRG
jgi:alpha-1,2-mannosyltransferase